MESREQQISECDLSSQQLLKEISSSIQLLSTTDFTHAFNKQLASLNSMLSPFFHDFKLFIQQQATSDDTWKFWIQFVFQDAMAYIGLYLAVRSGDWQLRVASMKMMAPIFTAFDHPSYQRLITQHLADITSMPPAVMAILKQGAFSVSISGRPWHSVGIDEAHEMLINKACKTSIVRPTQDYINRIAHYIPYRTKTLENVECNFFPESTSPCKIITSPYSSNPNDIKYEQNVQVQLEIIEAKKLFALETTNED